MQNNIEVVSLESLRDYDLPAMRDGVIDALLSGQRQLKLLSCATIWCYGDEKEGEERPERHPITFIVFDALPKLVQKAFLSRFQPVLCHLRSRALLIEWVDWAAFVDELTQERQRFLLAR